MLFGEVTVDGYDDVYKNYEIGRTKALTKSVALGNLEEMINEQQKVESEREKILSAFDLNLLFYSLLFYQAKVLYEMVQK